MNSSRHQHVAINATSSQGLRLRKIEGHLPSSGLSVDCYMLMTISLPANWVTLQTTKFKSILVKTTNVEEMQQRVIL